MSFTCNSQLRRLHIKIYIVEDDEYKGTQLIEFIRASIPIADCSLYKSLQSGLRAVLAVSPDILLLDMTIPNYDLGPEESGGQIHAFGGREILRQLDRFNLRVKVIVVTQFETFGKASALMGIEEIDLQLKADHPENYLGLVYYNAAIEGWKHDLNTLIGIACE